MCYASPVGVVLQNSVLSRCVLCIYGKYYYRLLMRFVSFNNHQHISINASCISNLVLLTDISNICVLIV